MVSSDLMLPGLHALGDGGPDVALVLPQGLPRLGLADGADRVLLRLVPHVAGQGHHLGMGASLGL